MSNVKSQPLDGTLLICSVCGERHAVFGNDPDSAAVAAGFAFMGIHNAEGHR